MKTLLLSVLLVVACREVSAQPAFAITWHTVGGGGGISTNGQFSLSGTIGQHDAGGAMSSGQYFVTGGFWALYAEQTPGAPALNITRNGNTVTVYWQNVAGWNLVQSGNLATPIASWSASGSPTLTGGTNYLNLPNPAGKLFFRLKNP
jgi:hypothetical protein